MGNWFDREAAVEGEQAVVDYMASLARAATLETPRLPDANVLWVKAQILRHWDEERKAQAPLDLMEPVQVFAGLAAAAVLLAWSLPSLLRAFSILRG